MALLYSCFLLVAKVDRPDYFPMFFAIAAFMAVCVVILFLTIKEKKLGAEIVTDEEKESVRKLRRGRLNRIRKKCDKL